jgi:hypothetical protein
MLAATHPLQVTNIQGVHALPSHTWDVRRRALHTTRALVVDGIFLTRALLAYLRLGWFFLYRWFILFLLLGCVL